MAHPESPNTELIDLAQQAQTLLRLQANYLQEQQLHENRLLGIKVFDGTHVQGGQGASRLQVYDGSVHNRLSQTEVPEHKLMLIGRYSLEGYGLNAVTFAARANLLTGEAKYSSESTVMWMGSTKVDRNTNAWRFIIPHLTNLEDFFRGKYHGPSRLS